MVVTQVLSYQGSLLGPQWPTFSRMHSLFFGPFLSFRFFPPNFRAQNNAQNHAQENPLLVLFMLAQKCLWTLRVQKCAKNHTFLNSCII
jgi:hypothetical protein